jgi:hypothetical protein
VDRALSRTADTDIAVCFFLIVRYTREIPPTHSYSLESFLLDR